MNPDTNEVSALPVGAIDPNSSTPLYHQIETDLRRLIQSGELKPGSSLPSELELSRVYGVGRQTMRLALSRLVADDLIDRSAGRGTFIKAQADRTQFYLDRSFTRQIADMGLKPYSKVLTISKGVIDTIMPPQFHPYLGQPYLHLVRLRLGDNEPIALQSTRILLQLCPGLEQNDFNLRSLYEVLAADYKLAINRIDHKISAAAADELQAGLLQITKGAPVLLVTTSAFLDNQQLIEETLTYYRADKYEYYTSHRYSVSS